MATPRAPWTTAMLDALAQADDGLDVEEILAVGMRAVPPGRALRERERINASHRDDTGTRRTVSDEVAIRSGARSVARGSLIKLIRNGLATRDGHRVQPTTTP